jgi:hypothetical protein
MQATGPHVPEVRSTPVAGERKTTPSSCARLVRAVVRVPLREHLPERGLVDRGEHAIVDVLAHLVVDEGSLPAEAGLRQALREKPHAIALEPQNERNLLRGNGYEVARLVQRRRAVEVSAAGRAR